QTVLQILAKTIVDSERNNQRGHSRCNPSNGDTSDDADNGLSALGTKIARGNKEFESHPQIPRPAWDFGTRLRRRASAASSNLIWTSAVGLLGFNEEIIVIQAVLSLSLIR